MKRISVPDMGDFKDVPVIEVLVAVGDTVAKEQPLVVVESEKATMDVPSSDVGVVASIEVKIGDRVNAGSPLVTLRSGPETAPPIGGKDSLGVVCQPTSISTPETDAMRPQHERLIVASSGPRALTDNVESIAASAELASHESSSQRIHAGPAVRKLARELGVNLEGIKGTGRRGRLILKDVHRHVRSMHASQRLTDDAATSFSSSAPFALLPWPKVDYAKFGSIDRQPLSRIRKISGANLHRNWVMIPHVTNHDDADVTELEAFRAELSRENQKHDAAKVSPISFIMKACVSALKMFPQFNASLEGEALVVKHYYHIGFAADTPTGLVVPVIRDANLKGVMDIAKEMAELAAKARTGKLASAEMQGGSFSISSLGGIGGTYFTPIINAPEVAILGVGKTRTRVVWVDGEPQPRAFLPLSLSWDHRVVDGAAAGRFNAHVVKVLSDLRRLLL